MTLPTAIVLGADSPIGLAVVRELGARGVPVHAVGRAAGAVGLASRWCIGRHLRGEGALETWLPALVARTGAAALFAISEGDLVALSRFGAQIGSCRLLTPRIEQLAMVLDKALTLAVARGIGIDTPESWQPKAGDDMPARAAGLRYPVVVKWADPAAVWSRLDAFALDFVKAEYAQDAAQLLAILARYDPLGCWPLVQAYAPGIGLGQMLYMADGRATLRFQHRRIDEWPPEGGVSTLCAAEPMARHAAQMALSEALLARVGWEGPAMVEYRHDPATGRYALMEINGRFWGSLPLARASGAAFAWEGYRRVILGETTPAPLPRDDLRARYMVPETRRLGRVLFHRGAIADPFFHPTPGADLARYLAGFVDPRMHHYVWDWRDPMPFVSDVRSMIAKLPWGRLRPAAKRRLRSA